MDIQKPRYLASFFRLACLCFALPPPSLTPVERLAVKLKEIECFDREAKKTKLEVIDGRTA